MKMDNHKNSSKPPDDIRAGLTRASFFSSPIKWWQARRYRREHKKLHNENALFYTVSPMTLEGIVKAFNYQLAKKKLGIDLLKNHSYWEFGVFKGFSLWFAQMYAGQYGISNFQFYGFDSFAGLPESKVDSVKPAFGKGHYAADYDWVVAKLKELGCDFQKVKLYKGFYTAELFNNLKKNNAFLPISILLVDCDIYESALVVLDFVKDFLVPGSLILFDDFNAFYESNEHGERRALREFEAKNPNFKKSHLFDFGWHGEAFEVTNI